MPIDWFTVVAQILNFLVLIWLLKRFLYGPVLKAMAERQERTRQLVADAEAKMQDAEQEKTRLEAERHELAQRVDDELNQSRAKAKAEETRLLDAAQREFEQARARWNEALVRERTAFQQEIAARAREEVIAIAKQALGDLADTDLQNRMVRKFITLLGNMNPHERDRFASLLTQQEKRSVRIRSAFELTTEQRTAVIAAAQAIFPPGQSLEFELKPNLVCGIELALDGHKIAWTIDDYLRALEGAMEELIATKERQHESRERISAAAGQ
jgi:F-type H+-transporting ATPase subunit b